MALRDTILKSDGRGLDDPRYADRSLRELTPDASLHGVVTVHFKDLRQALIATIRQYPIVVGCVAWLTNVEICRALATREHASIIIQKGDFLRPDAGDLELEGVDALRKRYQKTYGLIGSRNWERHQFPEPLGDMSYGYSSTLEGVRCAGMKTGGVKPLMHHKFAVFCDDVGGVATPRAVWTGSYNWTNNGENSLENAVLIEDAAVAGVYFYEWMRVTAISEPLDWKHRYVAPQWRIGS